MAPERAFRRNVCVVLVFVATTSFLQVSASRAPILAVSLDTPGQSNTIQLHPHNGYTKHFHEAFEKLTQLTVEEAKKQQELNSQYFAMCVVIKDQHKDIREWVEYHKMIGASKFYIYDHNSTVPLSSVLDDHIQSGTVVHLPISQSNFSDFLIHAQMFAFNHCLQEFHQLHHWMAFADSDEFFVIRDGTPSMPALLKDYEAYGALGVNWIMFGSSGHVARPPGGVLQNYWRCTPADFVDNRHIKTIANAKVLAETPAQLRTAKKGNLSATIWDVFADPHSLRVPIGKGNFCVDEKFRRIAGPRTEGHSMDRIALHHYAIKSSEDFEQKHARGSGMGNRKGKHFWEIIEAASTDNCTDALLQRTTLTISMMKRLQTRKAK